MKRIVTALFFLILVASLTFAADKKDEKKKPNPIQSIIGDWQGSMKVRSDRLTLIVHITMGKDGNLHATVDSPRQQFFDLPADIRFSRGTIQFVMPKLSASFQGQVSRDYTTIKGYFFQNDVTAGVTLVHSVPAAEQASIVNDEPDKPAVTADFLGDWVGELSVGAKPVRIVLHIRRNRYGTKASVDSPDQDTFGINVSTITSEDKKLNFTIPDLKAVFEGVADDTRSTITGTFTLDGKPRPLVFTKS